MEQSLSLIWQRETGETTERLEHEGKEEGRSDITETKTKIKNRKTQTFTFT